MIGVGAGGPRRRESAPRAVAERRPSGPARWRDLDLAALDAEAERPYWIAFSAVPGIGQAGFAELVLRHGSACAAWQAGESALASLPRSSGLTRDVLRRLRREGAGPAAARLESETAAAGGRIVTALDAAYPEALRRVDPRPPVLHVKGDDDSLAAPCVALVGTRRPSGYGRSCAIAIADELARAEVTVVSGLALGIDGEAHRAAIAAEGRSVAVLPSPLDRIYPPRHRELASRLVASGGMLVTELGSGQPTGRPDFARRNRLIAGLAQVVVVIEAPNRSGALLTAAAAIGLGRDLYAVPGPIDAIGSTGCNRLIADHDATIVTSPLALLQQLGVARGPVPPVLGSLSDSEALVLAKLLHRPGSIEELMPRTELSAGELTGALTLLEVRGLVTSFGGATFHPTLAARRWPRPV